MKAEPGSPKLLAKAAAALAVVVLTVGSFQLTRPGYSVDEEFTVFAVRGIEASGLPILPSGLLYDRGIAYSYLVAGAAGAAGATGGVLVAGRFVSLACAALVVFLTYVLVRRVTSDSSGVLAAVLVATSVPFWATATTGRFYASFLAVFLGLLFALSTLRTSCTLRTLCTIAALSALARWTHELAFLCAAIPALCWLLARGDRRRWLYATIAVIAGLLAGQAVILALHALAPSSGDTMVRRFFLWQVLNLFERPGDRQFGIPLLVMVLGLIVAPKRALPMVVALSVSAMIVAFSIAQATNTAPLSLALVSSVLVEGSRYPLDMFWHIYRTTPLTMLLALSGLGLRAAGAGGECRFGERAAHGVWLGWVLWFGVIESGITTNYLLLPVSFMLVAIAIDLVAILITPGVPARRAFSNPSRPALAGVVVLALLVTGDQWRTGSLESARPTITGFGVEEIRAGLLPADRVVCTDELGCLMLVGRIDRWLALDDFVRERFLVRRGDGPVSGVYTGVPAAFRPNDLFIPNVDGTLPDRVLIVDIFKEYPIGNSRSWLPKAIEEDGLQVTPLLETPQMRVLQVSPPERVVSVLSGSRVCLSASPVATSVDHC